MKKAQTAFFVFVIILFLMGCQSNRVFVAEELEYTAIQEFDFSEVTFFKTVDEDTANQLTEERFRNGGILLGIQAGNEKMLFVPRLKSDPIILLDFPYSFSFSSLMTTLNNLENELGEKLYVDTSNDYGGLTISTAPIGQLKESNPSLYFTSEIVFTFTTMTDTFYVASVENACTIFSASFLLINE